MLNCDNKREEDDVEVERERETMEEREVERNDRPL